MFTKGIALPLPFEKDIVIIFNRIRFNCAHRMAIAKVVVVESHSLLRFILISLPHVPPGCNRINPASTSISFGVEHFSLPL